MLRLTKLVAIMPAIIVNIPMSGQSCGNEPPRNSTSPTTVKIKIAACIDSTPASSAILCCAMSIAWKNSRLAITSKLIANSNACAKCSSDGKAAALVIDKEQNGDR